MTLKKLTERQQEVLDLLLAHYSQKSIATFLKITTSTVHQNVKRLEELGYIEEVDHGRYIKKVIHRVGK